MNSINKWLKETGPAWLATTEIIAAVWIMYTGTAVLSESKAPAFVLAMTIWISFALCVRSVNHFSAWYGSIKNNRASSHER